MTRQNRLDSVVDTMRLSSLCPPCIRFCFPPSPLLPIGAPHDVASTLAFFTSSPGSSSNLRLTPPVADTAGTAVCTLAAGCVAGTWTGGASGRAGAGAGAGAGALAIGAGVPDTAGFGAGFEVATPGLTTAGTNVELVAGLVWGVDPAAVGIGFPPFGLAPPGGTPFFAGRGGTIPVAQILSATLRSMSTPTTLMYRNNALAFGPTVLTSPLALATSAIIPMTFVRLAPGGAGPGNGFPVGPTGLPAVEAAVG